MLQRRSFLAGLLAAPAVIRTPGLLMPVRRMILPAQNQSLGVLKIFSGGAPWSLDAADPVGELCAMEIASVGRTGTASVIASGMASSYRFYDLAGRCIVQGCASHIGLAQLPLAADMTVSVNSFEIVGNNA